MKDRFAKVVYLLSLLVGVFGFVVLAFIANSHPTFDSVIGVFIFTMWIPLLGYCFRYILTGKASLLP